MFYNYYNIIAYVQVYLTQHQHRNGTFNSRQNIFLVIDHCVNTYTEMHELNSLKHR